MKLKAVVIVSLLVLILTLGAANAESDTLSSDASIDDATSEQLTIGENSNFDNSNEKLLLEENSNFDISNDELLLEENSNGGCSTSEQPVDDVKDSSSQKNTLGADDGRFTTLQNKINQASENSTIYLENNYYYDVFNDYVMDTLGIEISKSLTINGGGYTIDGRGVSRIFRIPSGVEVVLMNMQLVNGMALQEASEVSLCSGGGIYNEGDLTLFYTDVTGCKAFAGAGIYSVGSLKMYRANFMQNTGNRTALTFYNSWIYYSRFVSNSVQEESGVPISTGGEITILNLTVTDNYIHWLHTDILINDDVVLLTSRPVEVKTSSTYNEGESIKVKLDMEEDFFNGRLMANITNVNTGASQLVAADFTNNEATLNIHPPIGKYTIGFDIRLSYDISYASAEFSVLNKSSFTALSNRIANATGRITLDRDHKYIRELEPVITEGILIDHNLTINGAGHTIDANEISKIFRIASNATVVIENITLINAKDGDGAAIHNDGTLTLRNVTIRNITSGGSGEAIYNGGTLTASNVTIFNVTGDGRGGAIFNSGTSTLYNLTLYNCTASNGGLIYNEGLMEISRCTMSDATARNGGGAIFNGGTLTLSNMTLDNCTASDGGLVYNNGLMEISRCTMSDATVTGVGGAIFNGGTLTLSNMTLYNCTASDGGLIKNDGKIEITDSTLTNSSARGRGGAIYSQGNFTLSNVTLSNATSGGDGGLIYSVAPMEIKDSTLFEASANGNGGAIYSSGTLSLDNVPISNVSAGGSGGAIYSSGTLSLDNVPISNVSAGGSGGAIYSKAPLEITDSSLENSSAGIDGGAIYSQGNLKLSNVSLSNASAGASGGLIYSVAPMEIKDCTLFEASANGNGGAIYSSDTSSLDNVSISNVSAGDSGGAIYSSGASSLDNVSISNVSAGGSGGAIYSSGASSLDNVSISNVSAGGSGGAIYSSASLSLDNVSISNGSAVDNGGAIYSKAALEITNSTLVNNSAGIDGGAIFNIQKNTNISFIIINNTFTDNVAGQFGGAIYEYKWESIGTTAITDNNFTDNTAEDGSAVYVLCPEIYIQDMGVPDNDFNNNNYTFSAWENRTEINVTGNTFRDIQDAIDIAKDEDIIYLDGITYTENGGITINKTLTFIGQENTVLDSNDGGCFIYIVQEAFEVTFKDINFTHYAGIEFRGFDLNIINCTFDNITRGNVIYIDNADSNITVLNSTFANSIFQWSGGGCNYAIYSRANDKLVVDGCNFISNNCTIINGAGIYCSRTNDVIITNTTFNKNAFHTGMVNVMCRNFTLADSTFEDNRALTGCIELGNLFTSLSEDFDCEVQISNCSFVRNNAQWCLGFWQFSGSYGLDFCMEDCKFDSNYNTGSVIVLDCSDRPVNHSQIFRNCSFTNTSGGSSIINITGYNQYIVDCIFENNSETCVYGWGYSLNTWNCSFKNNTAEGMQIRNEIVNVLDCVFENNSARGINIGQSKYVTIENCGFTNNTDGGIYIYNFYSLSTIIRNCSFSNNSAGEYGGAINMRTNNTLITDCSFSNNSALRGGAIYMNRYLKDTKNVTIKNCSFSNNSAREGGAVYAYATYSCIRNCSFNDNYVTIERYTAWAGALYYEGTDNVLTNCSFANNFASSDLLKDSAVGAVYFISDNGILANCSFTNNFAVQRIGALYFMGNNAILANCSFINNSVNMTPNNTNSGGPGAVEWQVINGTIINCSFIGNSGYNYGGALDVYEENVTVKNCTFINNTVKSGNRPYNWGGALMISSFENHDSLGNAKIEDCIFIDNCAIEDNGNGSGGGAIAIINDNSIIFNCTFENNYALGGIYKYGINGGGAIYYNDYWEGNYNSTIINSTFKSNKISKPSLNVNDKDYSLTLSFDGYESFINAIYYYKDSSDSNMTFNLYNVTYWDNGEELNTGELTPIMDSLQTNQELTLEIYDSDGTLIENFTQATDSDGNLVYNYIDLPGGNYTYIAYHPDNDYYGYAVVEGNFSVNSTFSSLNEKIRLAADNTTLKKDYTFDPENDTDFTDGIIIDKNITIYGEGHTIDANDLARIFNVTEGATLTLVNVTLINGHKEEGGAIYNKGTLIIIDSLLEANNATTGGAIYNNGTLNIVNSTFERNNATDGGAIYSRNDMAIKNSRFENNTASFFGIILGVGNSTINNSTITNNHGERGTVFNDGNMTINDCNITNNYARVMGGGVCNFFSSNTTINNSTIKDNYANNGGGLFTGYGDRVTLNDVKFIDNQVDDIYSSYEPEVDTRRVKFLTGVTFEIENISDFMNGSPITITVSETKKGEEFNGYVTIAIGEEKFSIELVNGTGSATVIPNLEPGTYAAELTFYETDKYEESSATSNNFTVTPKMVPTTISYQALTSVPGGDNYLIAVLKDNEGNLLTDKTITLAGDVEASGTTNSNGKAIFDLSDLKPGDYSITISYAGEDGLYPTSETVELTIPKVNTQLDVSLVDGVLTAILTEGGSPIANKNISVKINDSLFSNLTDSNGKVIFDLNDIGPEDIITVSYTDDDGFVLTESVKVVEKINEIEVPINATIGLTYTDGKAVARLTDLDGNPLADKNLVVNVDGTPLLGAKTDDEGVYSINASGNTTIVVSYYSEGASVSATLTLNEIETIVNNTVYINNTVEVEKIVYVNNTIEVPVEVEKIVYVNNTVEVPVEVEKIVYVNNTVEVPVEVEKIVYVNSTTDIPIDTEKIVYINQTVEVPVEVEKIVYVNDTTEIPVEVEKIVYINNTVEVPVYINKTIEVNNTVYITPNRTATVIEYKNMVTTVVAQADGRVGEYFYVRLTDDKGNALANKPIKIGFNGRVYDRTTDSEGGAKLQINLGYKGVYTFAIGFLGDDEYTGAFEVASITVNLQKPQLTTSSKTYKASAKTKTLSATFKTVNGKAVSGKKISFTVNGKTYTGTTDAKGVATVKVSLSKKGTYSFTVKYAGDNQFATISKNAKLTIK